MHLSKIKFVLFDVFIRYEYILKEAWRIYISIPDTWVTLLYYVCNTSFLFNTLESGILLLFKTCSKFFSKLKISFSTICEINTCSTRFIIYSYSAVQCSTVQYSTVQYSTIQYSAIQQDSTAQYRTVQYCTSQFS